MTMPVLMTARWSWIFQPGGGGTGKLVLAGRVTAGNGTDEHAVVLRLDADGTLDSGFGNGGLAIVDTGASISLATGVYVAEGQRLHVSGQRQIDNPDPETNISEGFVGSARQRRQS